MLDFLYYIQLQPLCAHPSAEAPPLNGTEEIELAVLNVATGQLTHLTEYKFGNGHRPGGRPTESPTPHCVPAHWEVAPSLVSLLPLIFTKLFS